MVFISVSIYICIYIFIYIVAIWANASTRAKVFAFLVQVSACVPSLYRGLLLGGRASTGLVDLTL